MKQPPPHASSLFRGRHFDRTVIILCVRWYITYKLSYRDLVEMMAERGVAQVAFFRSLVDLLNRH
jgi:hypothetical protein